MLIRKTNGRLFRQILKFRCYSTLQNDEYVATPQYPKILDLSFDKKLERKKAAVHEAIKAVKTVEEKQIKLNMPRYYGFKCYMLLEDYIPYDNLILAQHATRTHLIESPTLPEFYNKINLDVNFDNVKKDIEESVLVELDGHQRMHDLKSEKLEKAEVENLANSSIAKQINRIIINNLSHQIPHLSNAELDYDSRIEACWFAGGMNPPENIKRYRAATPWQEHRINEPTDRAMDYVGSAMISLRSDKPLSPIISYEDCKNLDLKVPFFNLDPRTTGTLNDYRHIANVPGYWPGDPNKYSLLSYHSRGHLLERNFNDPIEQKEAVHRQGILASFGWLNAQANFLGFTTFNDITYPLVTQSIITNGKLWSFYIYQLNTICFHTKYINENENPKRNICWATPELKLYDTVENGKKLIGFDEEVLKNLLKLYLNVPQKRLGVNMTPFLSPEENVSADYADDEKTEWLEKEYKFLVSNRPRAAERYQVFHWEKFYKIDNKTRPLDPRHRPFERGIKPFNRPLDERLPRYIPRAHRPHLHKSKGRSAKEFFP